MQIWGGPALSPGSDNVLHMRADIAKWGGKGFAYARWRRSAGCGAGGRSERPEHGCDSLDPSIRFRKGIGPYALRELIGVGGMGEVYRAADSKLGRDVALNSRNLQRASGFSEIAIKSCPARL